MTELSDQEARDRIAEATSATLFVEAGAGTGKTTALVTRIIALVAEGLPVANLAAITFTEKAAAELSEKVRKALEAAAEAESDALRRGRFAAAVRELDQAAIQTLHSFAMRIISLHPLEAGLPPRISLRDDVEAGLAFDDRWGRFRDQLLDDPAMERLLMRGLTVGLRLRDLEDVAERLNQNWDRLEDLHLPQASEPRLTPEAILEPLAELRAMRRPDAEDSLTRKLDGLSGFCTSLQELSSDLRLEAGGARERLELDFLRILARTPELARSTSGRPNVGQQRNWADVNAARDLLKEAELARATMLSGERSYILCALLPRLVSFVLELANERRRQGQLEYHDLLVLARNVLRQRPDVRRDMHRRFQRILIDEFQDTDPLQIELAALLAHAGDNTPPNWRAAQITPGSLFFVGDPKQSIYRFRRADIELFKTARGAFSAEHVTLRKNFRCRPGIIDWVNETGRIMFSQFGMGADDRQADWIDLEAGVADTKAATVGVLGGSVGGSAADVRQHEANAIAATVLTARRDNWLGQSRKGEKTRFSDIAILLPTRTNSPVIERALAAAGIPTRVESRSLLFAAQEIRDLTNILAAIDDPTDDVAVVAALRSPAFAVDDADLLRHVNAGGRWDYTAEVPGDSPDTAREGMEALRDLHAERWRLSIGALVERVIARRKMLELAVSNARPREAWRRLRFVSEQARSLGDSGTVTSLRQFVHWLRTQASEGVRIAEAVANEPDDDAVRILTVHAAKGLEFPIVILAGLGIERRFLAPRIAWGPDRDGHDTIAVRLGRQFTYFETPEYEAFSANERAHDWLERDRLFYVAATRAQERLIVSLYHKEQGKSHDVRHAGRSCATAECLTAIQRNHPEWPVLQHGMAIGTGEVALSSIEDSDAQRAAWLSEREATLARLSRARVVAATRLAHGPTDEEKEERDFETQPWKKGRAGTSVGRAVHAVMQSIDLRTGGGLFEIAQSQAIAEGIPGREEDIEQLVENARNSYAVQAALHSGKYWRELYVGCEIDGMLVEGFIDLLYETPEGLVVVDYKTDSVRDESDIDRAMERYRLQGAAYALMIEQALGRHVAACTFVFTEPRTEREVGDLPGALAEVEMRIRTLSATPPAG
jgi:ATP-dependent exoDNAse (exonuclease V) beta subunit